MEVSNIKKDKTKYNTNIKDIIKSYKQNNTKEVIIDNISKEITLIGNKNLNYKYSDNRLFDTLYIPELLRFYITNNIIEKEKEEKRGNNKIYSINNELHLINDKDYNINNIKDYIKIINNKKKLEIELKNNITLEKEVIENKKESFNYGYINILLISLFIAIATIIFCITRLK